MGSSSESPTRSAVPRPDAQQNHLEGSRKQIAGPHSLSFHGRRGRANIFISYKFPDELTCQNKAALFRTTALKEMRLQHLAPNPAPTSWDGHCLRIVLRNIHTHTSQLTCSGKASLSSKKQNLMWIKREIGTQPTGKSFCYWWALVNCVGRDKAAAWANTFLFLWSLHLWPLLLSKLKGYNLKVLVETFLNPVILNIEKSLSLGVMAVVKDSSMSAISLANPRNEGERNQHRPRVASCEWLNDRHTCYMTQYQTLTLPKCLLPGCKEDTVLHANCAEHRAHPQVLCALWRKWLTLVIKWACSIILFRMYV